MSVLESPIPRFHLAVPVDDLSAARRFYGDVLGLEQGRSADTWVDWNLHGHQSTRAAAPPPPGSPTSPTPADMQALADFALAIYGRIDILVNNAGLMLFSYWKDLALDDWNWMIDVNIRGYLNGVHAALPVMLRQKSGHILNMDSVAGHQVGDGAGVCSAT
jgi:NAD(P)-dependent dehydrogenase (short-subunit alcohol dehydrogenase family)